MSYQRLSPGVYRNQATGQLVKSATMPVDTPQPISPGGMIRKPNIPPVQQPMHTLVGQAPINTNNSVAGMQNILNQQHANAAPTAPPAPGMPPDPSAAQPPPTAGVDPNATQPPTSGQLQPGQPGFQPSPAQVNQYLNDPGFLSWARSQGYNPQGQ